MTGYGELKKENEYAYINVQIQSLNSRFFDFYIKTGKILSVYDNEIRNKIKRSCARGNFQLKISIDFHSKQEITIDQDKILDYMNVSKQIQSLTKNTMEELSIDKLMSMSDIYKAENDNCELIKELYFECVDGAIIELNNSRMNEGKNIESSLKENIKTLEDELEIILNISKVNVNNELDRYNDKINNMIKDLDLDKSRLYQEIAIMIEKKDINEELVRLQSHLNTLKKYLDSNSEVGKKINFMLQEVGREINTISSKCSNIDITHAALNMKNELEKIREQAQNIL